jgi:lipopolysaccharide assembly outer membrane protein LptD (OstA)
LRKYYYITLILLLTGVTFSQQTGDSLFFSPIDSLKKTDTTKPTGEVDAIIEYSASDSAVFDIANHELKLYNEGDLKYKEFELKAARIILYRDNSTLVSSGIPDTAGTGKFIGTPVFYEGSKKYEGSEVRYNFKTRQGNITMGTTELEGGYYLGEKIKKVSEDVYFIQDGRYTTCNKSDPDYYFGSPRMKVIQGDKVIAEPVYLYVDDVPIFAIPFGIFPNHSGRSSGLIAPAYGEDATYGRYLSHLGYFWAISDYMDLALQGNYFTKGRLDLSMRYRYALRYKFTGELDLGGSRIRLGEPNDLDKVFSDDWQIGIVHNQSINPSTSLTANVNFISSKRYYDNSTNNLNNLLLQNAISNVTLSKSWEGTPNSISINYYRDQNLQTGEINERIPSISFTKSQSYPFRGKNASLLDLKWYESIAYDYNGQLLYSRAKTLQTDAVTGVQSFNNNNRGGVQQNLNVSAPFKFSEFSLSPFVSYSEIWYNKSIERFYDPVSKTVVTNDVAGFKTFRYFSTGISANSRIIGIFNTDFLGVKGFRHTVTPTVTYSYQPDFSKPFWNSYGTYTDSTGQVVKYSLFEREVFGSAPTGEAQSMSFSLGNVFEMKVKQNDTTDNKFQILNLNAGVSYNFAKDSLKLSELGLSYRTQIASLLNIGGGASFNFYKYADGVGRINKFLWNTDKRIADLTSFNINLSTTLQGNQLQPTNDSAQQESEDEYIGIYEDKPPDFSIPWSVSFNYNYSLSHPSPSVTTKYSNVSSSLMFSLTKNWKFTFSAGYDIFNKEFTAPYITVYRDLHCWEMSFNWIPTGLYRGFKFELRIKAPQLQDVKVTKESNYRGVY